MRENVIPPGWDENPTNWPKRLGLTALAFAGFCIALYLTLYQVGLIGGVWDPFFDSTVVLDLLGFPDASLGVLAYGAEIALTLIGGRARWRTAPWTVVAFGLVVTGGFVVSVVLIVVQPAVAGEYCTLCLASAAVSLTLFGWGIDETLAGLQYLSRVRRAGGGGVEGALGNGEGR